MGGGRDSIPFLFVREFLACPNTYNSLPTPTAAHFEGTLPKLETPRSLWSASLEPWLSPHLSVSPVRSPFLLLLLPPVQAVSDPLPHFHWRFWVGGGPRGVFGKERRCAGEDQGKGSAGRLGPSWWFGMMVGDLTSPGSPPANAGAFCQMKGERWGAKQTAAETTALAKGLPRHLLVGPREEEGPHSG